MKKKINKSRFQQALMPVYMLGYNGRQAMNVRKFSPQFGRK